MTSSPECRFTEAPSTFSAVDPATGDAGPGSPPKSDVELTRAAATIFLHDSGWVESGANHERVDVTWLFGFDPSATGQIVQVEAAATDDDGFAQPFEPIGTLAIGAVCGGGCGSDGTVAVNELVLAVNIAIGELSLDACLAADENRNDDRPHRLSRFRHRRQRHGRGRRDHRRGECGAGRLWRKCPVGRFVLCEQCSSECT